ncbi:hypothetical protein IJD44_01010 [bacterium]|nr:hypothetical protein [bacterium]
MKVYFENSQGIERVIGLATDEQWAYRIINDFCAERNYTIHYMRSWKDERGRTVVDVGSWSEFFYIEE